ncbi:MAG: menaquinone-dependent protoporphyrinogen dehydrogenase [Pseudomonadota bacterium]
MKPILIIYVTREGQTRRVVEHIDAHLQQSGVRTSIYDLTGGAPTQELYLLDYSAVIIAASVHNRSHGSEVTSFVLRQLESLNQTRSMFLSVSAAQIVAEHAQSPRVWRMLAAKGAHTLIGRFLASTSFLPTFAHPVAGALAYSAYQPATRCGFLITAWLTHLPTDAGHDYEYTDFEVLDRQVDHLTAPLLGLTRHV